MLQVLFAFLALLFSSPIDTAFAAFTICNNTGSTLNVSVAWYNSNGWNSRGWYNLNPNGCATPVGEALINQYLYYYAEGNGLLYASNDGSDFFCADHNNKFYYTYDPASISNCEGYAFRQIDIGQYVHDYQLNLTETTVDPKTAALNCQSQISSGKDAFVACWIRQISTVRQQEILDCMEKTIDAASLAICSTQGYMTPEEQNAAQCTSQYISTRTTVDFMKCMANGELDPNSAAIVNCAIDNQGSYASMAACAGGSTLTPEQRRLYDCIASHYSDYVQAGMCVAGTRMSAEQQRIMNCVAQNTTSYMQAGVCAAAGNKLTPEQQVFVQCAVWSGGQAYAMAGCVGSQLTLNELQKCMTTGIGGRGCFGNNNTVVASIRNAFRDVTKGPGPNNEIVKGREAILGGDRGTVANIIRDPVRCALFIRKC